MDMDVDNELLSLVGDHDVDRLRAPKATKSGAVVMAASVSAPALSTP